MVLVLADNAFAKGAATFLLVMIVVGLVYGGYKVYERLGGPKD
jgi:hypothetical protein